MPSSEANTVRVLKISANSPADKAGMKAGNSIVKVNNHPVTNWDDTRRLLFGRAGTDVSVTFFDGVTEKTVLMTRGRIFENVANEANN